MEVKRHKVFVVHGRNEGARDAMFQFLRAIGLQPIEWGQAVVLTETPTPFVGEVLEVAFSQAQAVVVLLTGDDETRLRSDFLSSNDPDYEGQISLQARPNILFEAGMAFGRHPERTVLVQIGEIKPFSDIGGRHVVKINNSPERRHELAQRLRTAGCPVDLTGTDWYRVGDFQAQEMVHQVFLPSSQNPAPLSDIAIWLNTTKAGILVGLVTPRDEEVHETPISSSGYVFGLPRINSLLYTIQAFIFTDQEYQQGSSYINQEYYWDISTIHLGASIHRLFYRIYDDSGTLLAESNKMSIKKINSP